MPECSSTAAWVSIVMFFVTSLADRGSQPKITSAYQKEHWLNAGDTLRLTCPVASDPAPIITWRKDGDDIHIGWERFRIRDESLLVKSVEYADSGIYVCLATNGFGTATIQYSVCISGNDTDLRTTFESKDVSCNFNGNGNGGGGEMPSFLTVREVKDQDVQLTEGESAQLDCQATGRPRPQIRWFKDGREKFRRHNNAANNWLLTLNKVTPEDGGHYRCNVYNSMGSINYTYVVQVSGKIVNLPEFRMSLLKNVTAAVGSVASFYCEAYSDVETRIQWMRQVPSLKEKRNPNGTIVMEDKHFAVVSQGQTQANAEGRYVSKLTIYPVGLNDSGIYVCSAANSYGFQLQSAFLKVVSGKRSGDVDESAQTDYDGMWQFVPIVATVASIFLVLLLGIIAYFIYRQCLPSEASPSPSQRGSPSSSSESSFPVQRPHHPGCRYNEFAPLKLPHHPPCQQGSLTSGAVYVPSVAGATRFLPSSAPSQRGEGLFVHYQPEPSSVLR